MGQWSGEKRLEYILTIWDWVKYICETKSGVKDSPSILSWKTGEVENWLTEVGSPDAWRQLSSSVLDLLSFLCALELHEEMLSTQLDQTYVAQWREIGWKHT